MAGHSDDIPTDLSSSLSSPPRNGTMGKVTDSASSQVERLEEADKQILEWAAKLEMESVDLRDKSSQLLSVLQNNSKELCGVIKKLNLVLAKEVDIKEIKSSITDLSSHREELCGVVKGLNLGLAKEVDIKEIKSSITDLSSHLEERLKGINNQDEQTKLKALESTIKEFFDAAQERSAQSIEFTQELLLNITRQLENTQTVLVSMSSDMNSLSDRQACIEKRLNSLEFQDRANDECNNSATDVLHGTTLLNETDDEFKYVDGRKTRSKSRGKQTKPHPGNSISVKRIGKRRNLAQTRTIIPWEEIETYTSNI